MRLYHKREGCTCQCHDERNEKEYGEKFVYCSMCMDEHPDEIIYNKTENILTRKRDRIPARFKIVGRCCMPRDDCSPCELPENHKGLHKHGFFVYGDDGQVG